MRMRVVRGKRQGPFIIRYLDHDELIDKVKACLHARNVGVLQLALYARFPHKVDDVHTLRLRTQSAVCDDVRG